MSDCAAASIDGTRTGTTLFENLLIGSLARAGRRGGILAANSLGMSRMNTIVRMSAKPSFTDHTRYSSGNGQEPEQTLHAAMGAVRGRPQGRANDDEKCGGNERRLSPDPVAEKADRDLAKYRTWEEA